MADESHYCTASSTRRGAALAPESGKPHLVAPGFDAPDDAAYTLTPATLAPDNASPPFGESGIAWWPLANAQDWHCHCLDRDGRPYF